MSAGKIGSISIACEIDGKPHFIVLPHNRLLILVQLAASLSDTGKLPVMPAPEGYEFTTINKEGE